MQKKYLKFSSVLRAVLVVVFVGVIGTIAGVLGGLISPQVFLPEDIVQLRPIIFEDKTMSRKSEKDVDITDIVRTVAPSIGELYHIQSKYRTRDFGEDLLPFSKDFLGYALVGTADGWIILPPSVASIRIEEIRFIDSEKRVFRMGTRIKDIATGIQYAKISLMEDTTLKPIQFDITSDIGASKRVYQILNMGSGIPFNLTPLQYPPQQTLTDTTQSLSILKKRFNASDEFSLEGMPFVTEKGEIIGFSTAQGILPMAYVQSSFTQLLRSKKIERPTLSLRYIDLSLFPVGFLISKRGLIKNGAYIIAQKRQDTLRNLKENVPLVQGDIIVSVNNEILDRSKSFSEVVQQYKKGDSVTLEYFHGGEKKIAEVTLR